MGTSLYLKIVLVGLFGIAGQGIDPEFLIDQYALTNEKYDTINYDLDAVAISNGEISAEFVYLFQHTSDNDKKQWIGQRTTYNTEGEVVGSSLMRNIFGDETGVMLFDSGYEDENFVQPPQAFLVDSTRDNNVRDFIEQPSYGGPLTGRFYGSNNQSVYDLLKGAADLRLQNRAEEIIGYDAYLVEADTQYGTVRAWISPDLDYNCLRWEINKNMDQFDSYVGDFTNYAVAYEAEQIEQIDGQYVITQARFDHLVENGNLTPIDSTTYYNLSNIDFNPDYEALGAFEIQLPEGTVVTDFDSPGVKYLWADGQLQPLFDDTVIETIDYTVDDLISTDSERLERNEALLRNRGRQLPDPESTTIANQEENGLVTNKTKLLLIAFVIVALVLIIDRYRHSRVKQ